MANLDELILSGAFGTQSRSSSPARSASSGSRSPKSKWPGEDYEKDDIVDDIQDENPAEAPHESIGMGPGRTGVKGVIRDRAEALATERAKKSAEISALNRQMEKASLAAGGRTWDEDEADRRAREGLEPISGTLGGASRSGAKKYGYLREVGAGNYVSAVEDNNARVIVHIYDSSLERCYELDATLSKLARSSPMTKFIRVKATAIGFALKSASDTGALGTSSKKRAIRGRGDQTQYIVSEDADFPDDGNDSDQSEEAEADTDMLPTMLIYEKGELLHTWVRVDWEAGQDGIENLLLKHNLIARKSQPGAQGTAALSDDEEEE